MMPVKQILGRVDTVCTSSLAHSTCCHEVTRESRSRALCIPCQRGRENDHSLLSRDQWTSNKCWLLECQNDLSLSRYQLFPRICPYQSHFETSHTSTLFGGDNTVLDLLNAYEYRRLVLTLVAEFTEYLQMYCILHTAYCMLSAIPVHQKH